MYSYYQPHVTSNLGNASPLQMIASYAITAATCP